VSPLTERPPKDPYKNFQFLVEIDGITQAGFTEVTGFGSTTDLVDYRTGDQVQGFQKLPGLTKYDDITLKWGMTDSTELADWRQRIINGEPVEANRKNVYIVPLDSQGNELGRFHCRNCFPSKYNAPDFNAKGNDVAVIELTLTHEGVEFTS
jgi:phage tail-like protein